MFMFFSKDVQGFSSATPRDSQMEEDDCEVICDDSNINLAEFSTAEPVVLQMTSQCENERKQVQYCKGYRVEFEGQESFYRVYPFHRHRSNDPSLQLKYYVEIS